MREGTPRIVVAAFGLVVALGSGGSGAAEFTWDGDCALPIWWQQCAPAGTLLSNWTDDPNRPGSSDTVFIDAGFGQTSLGNSFTIQSCSVPGGLGISGSNVLSLTSGTSVITDLTMTGGGIDVPSGVSVEIDGTSLIGGTLTGPGEILVYSTASFNGAQIEDGAMVELVGADATLTTLMSMQSGTSLRGGSGQQFDLSFGADVFGSGATLESMMLSFGATGLDQSVVDPDLDGVGLQVSDDSEVLIRSQRLNLTAPVTIGTTSLVTLAQTFGGTDRTLAAPSLTGDGLLDVLVDMTVADGVVADLGVGCLDPGAQGGFRLNNAQLELAGVMTNNGRFRFQWGELAGVGPFINNLGGCAYTLTSGNGSTVVDIENAGRFEIQNQFIVTAAHFHNYPLGSVYMKPVTGGVTLNGTGSFLNEGAFGKPADGIKALATVTMDFDNQGTVLSHNGTLRFTGMVANVTPDGALDGGHWTVTNDGIIELPQGSIRTMKGGTVIELEGAGQVDGLEDLEEITEESTLKIGQGADVTLSPDSAVAVRAFSEFLVTVDAIVNISLGAFFNNNALMLLQYGGLVNMSGNLELGDENTVESIVPELQGIVILAEGADPPIVTTPVLNNHGRVLPTEREAIGVMQLNGDYVQHENGFLHIDVTDAGSDLISIDGSAVLGGTLELGRMLGSDPVLGQPYTVLTATAGVTGEFDEVDTLDTVQVTYLGDGVEVTYQELGPMEVFSDGFESGDTSGWSVIVP